MAERGRSQRQAADELVERGLERYGAGDLDSALCYWDEALELDPDNPRATDYVSYVRAHYKLLMERFVHPAAAEEHEAPFGLQDEGSDLPVDDAYDSVIIEREVAPVLRDLAVEEGWGIEEDWALRELAQPAKAPQQARQLGRANTDRAETVDGLALEEDVLELGPAGSDLHEQHTRSTTSFDFSDIDDGGSAAIAPPRIEPLPPLMGEVTIERGASWRGAESDRSEATREATIPGGHPAEVDALPEDVQLSLDALDALSSLELEGERPLSPDEVTTERGGRLSLEEPSELELLPPGATLAPRDLGDFQPGDDARTVERDGHSRAADATARGTDESTSEHPSFRDLADDDFTAMRGALGRGDDELTRERDGNAPWLRPIPTLELDDLEDVEPGSGASAAGLPLEEDLTTERAASTPRSDSDYAGEVETSELDSSASVVSYVRAADVAMASMELETLPMEDVADALRRSIDEDDGGDEPPPERIRRRITALLDRATAASDGGQHLVAVTALDLALDEQPDSAVAQKTIHSHRELLFAIYQRYLGDERGVPMLALPMHELSREKLDNRAAFLLSRIDGQLCFEEILDVAGMNRLEAYRYLSRLLGRGIVELR